jgi:hypothetical protein
MALRGQGVARLGGGIFHANLRLRTSRKTRYGWLAKPYPTGTFTLLVVTSFACRTNACQNGLGEVAAFLRLFAKMVTARPSPIACVC